jgi:hypothetical protein
VTDDGRRTWAARQWAEWAADHFGDTLINHDAAGQMLYDAVAAEREACVKIIQAAYYCDELDTIYGADRVVDAIRARADP